MQIRPDRHARKGSTKKPPRLHRSLYELATRRRYVTFARLAMVPYVFCVAWALNSVPSSVGPLSYIVAFLFPVVVLGLFVSLLRPMPFTCEGCEARVDLGRLAYRLTRNCRHCGAPLRPSDVRISMRGAPDPRADARRAGDPDADDRERQLAYAAVMNEAAGEAPSERVPSTPSTMLTKWAGTRGFDVVHPLAIQGEIGGVRVAVEREETEGGCTYVDADARDADAAALAALKTALQARIPRARFVAAGPIARIEIRGSDVDPRELDDALEMVEETLKRRSGGAYR